jgi:hypothetical protein
MTSDQITTAVEGAIATKKVAVVFSKDLKERVRATYKRSSLGKQIDLVVTIGKPNAKEREFLKLCKKAKTKPKPKAPWFGPR